MLWHLNARVNSHQRWKQTRFRVCFHLWCELTSTLNVTEWQVSWNSFSASSWLYLCGQWLYKGLHKPAQYELGAKKNLSLCSASIRFARVCVLHKGKTDINCFILGLWGKMYWAVKQIISTDMYSMFTGYLSQLIIWCLFRVKIWCKTLLWHLNN